MGSARLDHPTRLKMLKSPPLVLRTRRGARDAESTRANILSAARQEFARHGFEAARSERIATAARSSDRMVYYYFGTKEKLFIEVLEQAYDDLARAEQALSLPAGDPFAALDAIVAFTWQYYLRHPEFIALLNIENMARGARLRKSNRVRATAGVQMSVLHGVLRAGIDAGLFRPTLAPTQVYITIAALGYFYLSNRYTLSAYLGEDLTAEAARSAWLAHMQQSVRALVAAEAGERR